MESFIGAARHRLQPCHGFYPQSPDISRQTILCCVCRPTHTLSSEKKKKKKPCLHVGVALPVEPFGSRRRRGHRLDEEPIAAAAAAAAAVQIGFFFLFFSLLASLQFLSDRRRKRRRRKWANRPDRKVRSFYVRWFCGGSSSSCCCCCFCCHFD